jgi:hypothetical protein
MRTLTGLLRVRLTRRLLRWLATCGNGCANTSREYLPDNETP